MESRHTLRIKRKARIRARISGTTARPRLTVFRSNMAVYAQVIDDTKGETIVSVATKGKNKAAGKELGLSVAKLALAKGIKTVVFDRAGYRYHGTVKEIADAVREGGIKI